MDGLAYETTMPYLCQDDDGLDSDAMAMLMEKCPVECAFLRAYWVVREYSLLPLPLDRVAVVSLSLSIWLVLVLRLQLLKIIVGSTFQILIIRCNKFSIRKKNHSLDLSARRFSQPKKNPL